MPHNHAPHQNQNMAQPNSSSGAMAGSPVNSAINSPTNSPINSTNSLAGNSPDNSLPVVSPDDTSSAVGYAQFDIQGNPIEMTFAEIDADEDTNVDLRRQQRLNRINAIFAWQFYQDESIQKLITARLDDEPHDAQSDAQDDAHNDTQNDAHNDSQEDSGHTAQTNQFQPAKDIITHVNQLDEIILQYAPKHSLLTFNKIDLAILRQGLYELLYTHTPIAVVIDEAVEIAKQLGSEEAPNFVHGVLGNYIDDKLKK